MVEQKLDPRIKDAKVYLTHFRRCNYEPSLKDLRAAFARGMGIICQPNERGIDLIIPVCLDSAKDIKITDASISAIFIQVKNRQSSFSIPKTVDVMDIANLTAEISPGVPYITVLMSLWETTKRKQFHVDSSSLRLHITIQGLDFYACLHSNGDPDDASELKDICKSVIDHQFSLKHVYKEDIDLSFVTGMFPLEYQG